jgi:hypothetical protein
MPCLFDYAVLRVVPRVEREEFVNAAVVLFCPEQRYLGFMARLDEERWRALWPDVDVALVTSRLVGAARVVRGEGGIARNYRERFHWLVAPKSTLLQVSSVHTGVSDAPHATLERIFRQMVGGEAELVAVAAATD